MPNGCAGTSKTARKVLWTRSRDRTWIRTGSPGDPPEAGPAVAALRCGQARRKHLDTAHRHIAPSTAANDDRILGNQVHTTCAGIRHRDSTGGLGRGLRQVSFAEQVAALRSQAGMSLADVAAGAHIVRGYVHHIERGHRWPTQRVAKALDTTLGADGALLAAWKAGEATARPVPADPDEFERFSAALANPRRTDTAVVDHLARTLAEQRRAEDTLGARRLLELGRHADAVPLLSTASEDLAACYERDRARYSAQLARALAGSEEANGALTVAIRAAELAAMTGS